MSITTGNSLSHSDSDILVDRMLGSSYENVRTVAQNLPALKKLTEDPNIAVLTENYDKVDRALTAAPQLAAIGDNLNEVLRTGLLADRAKDSANKSEESCSQSKLYAQEAKLAAAQAATTKSEIDQFADDVSLVADNITAVQNISMNIKSLKAAEQLIGDQNLQDALEHVSVNMPALNKINKNMKKLMELNDALIDSGQVDKWTRILEEMKLTLQSNKDILTDMQGVITNFEVKTRAFDLEVATQAENIKRLGKTVILEINDTLGKIEVMATRVENDRKAVEAIKDECDAVLLKCRNYYNNAATALEKSKQQIISDIVERADKEHARIRHEGNLQVNRLQTAVESELNGALSNIKDAALEIKDDIIQSIQAEANASYEELRRKLEQEVNEAIKKINDLLNSFNLDLTDVNNRLSAIENQVKDCSIKVDSLVAGNKAYALVDYSNPTNQVNMVQGIAYTAYLDEAGQYIPMNPDTNSPLDPQKTIKTVREYTKSRSGAVTYRDISGGSSGSGTASLPESTETQKGIIRRATKAQALAGTGNEAAMTPLRVKEAFTSFLENELQAVNGNKLVESIVKIMLSDADLKEALQNNVRYAGYDLSGIIKLATTEEIKVGISNTVAVTPLNLKQALQELLIREFSANAPALTNNVVQQIVNTVCSDSHLIEPLAEKVYAELVKSYKASINSAGVVQLASVAETVLGLDSTKAVTPEGLKAVVDEIEANQGGTAGNVELLEKKVDVLAKDVEDLKKKGNSSFKVDTVAPGVLDPDSFYVIINN